MRNGSEEPWTGNSTTPPTTPCKIRECLTRSRALSWLSWTGWLKGNALSSGRTTLYTTDTCTRSAKTAKIKPRGFHILNKVLEILRRSPWASCCREHWILFWFWFFILRLRKQRTQEKVLSPVAAPAKYELINTRNVLKS